jgi:hypothetical protein
VRVVITVWAPSGRLRLRARIGLRETLPDRAYAYRWRVPSALRGGLRKFCVQAFDEEGKSRTACAPLRLVER